MGLGAAVNSVTLSRPVDSDKGSEVASSTRRRTCVVYTTDEFGRARSEHIYRPAIIMARRTLMTVDGNFAILDLAAGNEPPLDHLRAISAGLAGLVIVYETTRAPPKTIQALGDAEQVDFDASDPQWRQKLVARVCEALERLVAKHDRREQSEAGSRKPEKRAGGWSIAMLLNNAPGAAFAGALLGCLTTLDLTALGIASGIASALATVLLCFQLLVTRTTRHFAGAFFPALYGGTFGGMTPVLWLSDGASGHSAALTYALIFSQSVACGLAFFVVATLDARSATPIGAGYGGRSGAIATVASFLFVQLAWLLGADASRFHGIGVGAFGVGPWATTVEFFACLVGIIGTLLVLRQRRVASAGVAERIFAASAVALSGMIALHLSDPSDAQTLDAFYAGCFLGMSKPERLSGWFQLVLGALVLTAMLVLVHAFLPGVGGGLGFAAFVTVALVAALSRVTAWRRRDVLTLGRLALRDRRNDFAS